MSAPSTQRAPVSRGALLLYRVIRALAVGASRLYFPGSVVGREHVPATGPFILAPVHRSYVDWLIVARVTKRRMRYIVKEEVWKSKAVGRFIEMLGAFPVNRSGADREALERCRSVLEGGEPLVMFPEGTRCSGPEVHELRDGVAYLSLRTGAPIIPVGIGGSERAMPRGSVIPRPTRINLVIGAPITAVGGRTDEAPGAAPSPEAPGAAPSPEAPPNGSAAPSPEALPNGSAAGDKTSSNAARRRRARVPRTATSELSARLRASIQEVYDAAEASVESRRLGSDVGR